MDPLKSRESIVPYVLGLFVLVPFLAKPYIIIALFIYQMVRYRGRYDFTYKKEYSWFLSLVFANLLGLIFTQNFDYVGEYFLRLIPYVLLIPILANEKIDDGFIQKFTHTWIYSVFFYSIGYVVFLLYQMQLAGAQDLNAALSMASRQMFGFNEHPIYTSIYIGIALLLLMIQKRSISKYIMMGILLVIMLVLARKGPILYLGLATFLLLYQKKEIKKKWLIYAGFVMMLLVITYPFWFERFYEFSKINYSNSTGIRMLIWESVYNLLNQSYFMGYGTGDAKIVLNDYLETYTILTPYPYPYNCHNEYLEIMMKSGFLGLMVFLWGAYHILKKTYQNYFPGFLVIVYLYLNMLTESILERQNGILMYGIFIGIFLLYKKSDK